MEKMAEIYTQFLGNATTSDELVTYLTSQGKFSIPLDVVKVVEFLGISLVSNPDFKNMTRLGSIEKINQGIKLWFNPIENQLETRKRFTIAHELGHFFLHVATSEKERVDDDAISFNRDDNWDKYEREANQFAASLLMPTSEVFSKSREVIDAYKREQSLAKMPREDFAVKMAEVFNVSKSAMEYRLEALGVL